MISATLALLGCVGGDWMMRGGVARRDRSADKSEEVMAALDGCAMADGGKRLLAVMDASQAKCRLRER